MHGQHEHETVPQKEKNTEQGTRVQSKIKRISLSIAKKFQYIIYSKQTKKSYNYIYEIYIN